MTADAPLVPGGLLPAIAWGLRAPARRFSIATDELRLLIDPKPSRGELLAAGKWIVTRRPGVRVARSRLLARRHGSPVQTFATRGWIMYAEKSGLPLPIRAL